MRGHFTRVVLIAAALMMIVTASAVAAPSVRSALKSLWEGSAHEPVEELEPWHRKDQEAIESDSESDDELYEPPLVALPRGEADDEQASVSDDPTPDKTLASTKTKRASSRSPRRRQRLKRSGSQPPPNRRVASGGAAQTDPEPSTQTKSSLSAPVIAPKTADRDAVEDSFPPPPPPPPPPVQTPRENRRRKKQSTKKPRATKKPKTSRPKGVPLGF